MATSRQFKLDISAFVEKAKDRAELVARKVALDMFSKIVLKSPVDTGRFRGNWQVSVGAPAMGTLNTTDKSGGTAIGRITGAATTLGLGQTIYLTNNLPYAVRLEYGHSKQAPAGMVRTTIDEFEAAVAKAAAAAKQEKP